MKKVIGTFLSIFLAISLFAGETLKGKQAKEAFPHASMIYYKSDFSTPIFIEFEKGSNLNEEAVFNLLKQEFNIPSFAGFDLINSYTDELGITHKKFNQTVNGIPIYIAHFSLHLKEGFVISVSGKFYNELENKSAQIDENQALQNALNDFGAEEYKWEDPREEQFLKVEQEDPNATFYPTAELVYMGREASVQPKDMELCYSFEIYASQPLAKRRYFIDAQNGSVVFYENLIHHSNTQDTAYTAYSGKRLIITDSVSNYFRLRETTRGNGIETYDMNNDTRHANAVDFIDSNRVWNNFNPIINRYATDAHFATEMVYDYFQQIHNRNSIDNQGFRLRSYVHYSRNYFNAFWDGQRMTYGDGDQTTTPLTTLDITGHEVAHGLTNFSSALIYRSESGALNESFSDIFGVAVEQFARPGSWNWLMGEETNRAIRSMSNPNSFGDPDCYGGLNWVSQNCTPTSGNDWCGVHTNSGVQNYWFYLLTEGGSGVNDLGETFQVDSLGIIAAGKIAFRNNTIYLTPSSDYEEARFFAIRSAADLHGACSFEVEAVTDAWHAVGVGNAYSPGVSSSFIALNDTSFCTTPARVEFDSDGNNVLNFFWDFGDGTTSNLPDPVHVYNSYGDYTVRLIADGSTCGRDTTEYVNYIKVDSTVTCSFSLTPGLTQSNGCNGRVMDQGGANGNYPVAARDTLIVNSTGDQISLSFVQFDIESGLGGNCNHDYLEIFDGASTNSPSLGRFCNSNRPPANLLTSSSAFTLVFFSDNQVNSNGFTIDWACQSASSAPVANFTVSTDTTCDGRVNFYDLTSNGTQSWMWNFGDGNTSTLKNPSHQYSSDGSYNVTLTTSNSVGTDSIQQMNAVVVNRGRAPLVGNDSVCRGGDAKLWANGPADLIWYDSPALDRPVFNGDTLRLSNINNTRRYYVTSAPPVSSITAVPFQFAGSSYYTDTTESIYFDVYQPTVIETVLLRSNGTAGTRTVQLKNSQGQVIASQDAFISSAGIQVTLNFEIDPDTNYSLTIGSRNPGLLVQSTGATYPYRASGLMEIKSSSMGQNAYPFFFFMKVRPKRCESEVAEVRAFVDTTCVITSLNDAEINQAELNVYPNPFTDNISIEGDLRDYNQMKIYNVSGKLLYNYTINANQSVFQVPGLGNLAGGVYYISLEGENKVTRQKVVKLKP